MDSFIKSTSNTLSRLEKRIFELENNDMDSSTDYSKTDEFALLTDSLHSSNFKQFLIEN